MATHIGQLPVLVVPSTATTTAAPVPATQGFFVDSSPAFLAWCDYTAAATCTVQLWLRNPTSTTWHRGDTFPTLDPANGDQVVTCRSTFDQEFYLQVTAITGGSVTIYASAAG